MKREKKLKRCAWVTEDPDYVKYHDQEWGVPIHDDRLLFEFLVLEGAQAGLSWITILKKRENFRRAFDDFDVVQVAAYKEKKIQSLLKDQGIVRNELKIRSVIKNAQEFLNIQKEYGTFDRFIWDFVNHKTIYNSWKTTKDIPNQSLESDAMSKALKKRGFKFVGPTICYAFMQATGMIMDHTTDCFRFVKRKV
ncbi:DNA-3-methyladenine glycosylase I [Leptospira kirschneri]|uniref:DNA-3-methyladenine glycosylase I n=1 Tax=Leptospira kirschneri TaxID=29507 RepID=UPI0002784702|nr:DNA-3-methyladenine glycosylase I [Leptospira kirschneri]EJO69512.1 DNA-3-methyladenine glycosylase I [Leptospira kirschneri serovar Grippotyphosa str. RM52]EKR06702.1 DNA-3-methyladenine glycosylase I [Leptospira kirschneri serovar Valbuzzi str. 200702274]EMK01080.1 DNA-3-methyladenine glycosylase I [Leptospira kirschneri str. MMD1493]KON76230.1 DNA-3-methyladenine glycosylase I [Leptospira kirschneri serovar Mozdok]KPZ76028.1 3-methyladenine DNA glycosylase [Leptospira kirschneri serovar 